MGFPSVGCITSKASGALATGGNDREIDNERSIKKTENPEQVRQLFEQARVTT
jgi:hypothetical protein